MRWITPLGIAALFIVSAGCESQPRTSVRVEEHPRDSIPGNESAERTAAEARNPNVLTMAQRQAALEQLANEVTLAQTREAQTTALRRLWQHMRDHNYTYQSAATRVSDNERVQSPATVNYPIRLTMSIYQADQRLYDFSFQPMDNRDIEFLTRGS
jgi:hypothetical protein